MAEPAPGQRGGRAGAAPNPADAVRLRDPHRRPQRAPPRRRRPGRHPILHRLGPRMPRRPQRRRTAPSAARPRRPPRCEFEHRNAEFCRKNSSAAIRSLAEGDRKGGAHSGSKVIVHRAHFSKQFIDQLKATASSSPSGATDKHDNRLHYSTFVCVVAQLWRAITRSRRVDGAASTHLRISVNGRARLVPPAPDDYSGNLILWAMPRTTAGELVLGPVSYAAGLIQTAVAGLDDRYFRSFVDFASSGAVEEEGLVPLVESNFATLSPCVDVYSWNRIPFKEMDFSGGRGGNGNGGGPFYFVPSYSAVEGEVIVAPSFAEDGAIDAYLSLFEDNLASFVEECYSLKQYNLSGEGARNIARSLL